MTNPGQTLKLTEHNVSRNSHIYNTKAPLSEASTVDTLPDDAFRSFTLGLIQHVTPTALAASPGRQVELQALVDAYTTTSMDANMQQLVALLHTTYDLVALGCLGRGTLDGIIRGEGGVAGGVAGGVGAGGAGGGNEVQRGPQEGSMVDAVAEDVVEVGTTLVDGAPMPATLNEEDLGIDAGVAEEVKKSQNEVGYVVCWERTC